MPEASTIDYYRALLDRFRSGAMTPAQMVEHLDQDRRFKAYVERELGAVIEVGAAARKRRAWKGVARTLH